MAQSFRTNSLKMSGTDLFICFILTICFSQVTTAATSIEIAFEKTDNLNRAFRVLEIESTSSEKEVKRAYLKMMKIHFPRTSSTTDINSSEKAREIIEAKDLILNHLETLAKDLGSLETNRTELVIEHIEKLKSYNFDFSKENSRGLFLSELINKPKLTAAFIMLELGYHPDTRVTQKHPREILAVQKAILEGIIEISSTKIGSNSGLVPIPDHLMAILREYASKENLNLNILYLLKNKVIHPDIWINDIAKNGPNYLLNANHILQELNAESISRLISHWMAFVHNKTISHTNFNMIGMLKRVIDRLPDIKVDNKSKENISKNMEWLLQRFETNPKTRNSLQAKSRALDILYSIGDKATIAKTKKHLIAAFNSNSLSEIGVLEEYLKLSLKMAYKLGTQNEEVKELAKAIQATRVYSFENRLMELVQLSISESPNPELREKLANEYKQEYDKKMINEIRNEIAVIKVAAEHFPEKMRSIADSLNIDLPNKRRSSNQCPSVFE